MTISGVVRSMNATKVKVKTQRLIDLRGYYLSMYRVYMVRLYDACYISDPTIFDEKTLFKNIGEMGISDMTGYSGEIRLCYEQARFAYLRNNDETKREFLFNLMNALKYREYCLYIDKFYEWYGFSEGNYVKVRLNMGMQGSKVCSKDVMGFNEVTAECLTNFEDEIQTLNIDEYIWCLAMQELGIPRSEWNEDGILVDKMAHSSEVKCIEGILNGVFKVHGGKYSDRLIDWLKVHPWGNARMSIESKGLYDYVFATKGNEIKQVLELLLDLVEKDKDCTLVGMYGSKIYFKHPRKFLELPVGVFQILNEADGSEDILSSCNCVMGMTGEFYTPDRLTEDGYGYAGCPVCVYKTATSSILVYDREQTNLRYETWFENTKEACITFTQEDADNAPESPFIYGTLSDQIYKGYVNSLRSADGLITKVPVETQQQFEQSLKEVRKFIYEKEKSSASAEAACV